jgi:hypothetical protein
MAVAAALVLSFVPVVASPAAAEIIDVTHPYIYPLALDYGSPTNRPLTLVFELGGFSDDTTTYDIGLERKPKGGEWEATDVATQASFGTFTLTAPALSKSKKTKNTTVKYRAVIAQSPITDGYTSEPAKVSYQNTAKYTGLKLVSIHAVSKYCRSAVITIESVGGGAVGLYGTGHPNVIIIDPSMKRYPTLQQRTVAMHECGHYLQNEYGINNGLSYEQVNKRVKKIFGTNHEYAYEHMADCIAHAVFPQGGLGYGGKCSARQIKVAKRFLHDGTL